MELASLPLARKPLGLKGELEFVCSFLYDSRDNYDMKVNPCALDIYTAGAALDVYPSEPVANGDYFNDALNPWGNDLRCQPAPGNVEIPAGGGLSFGFSVGVRNAYLLRFSLPFLGFFLFFPFRLACYGYPTVPRGSELGQKEERDYNIL